MAAVHQILPFAPLHSPALLLEPAFGTEGNDSGYGGSGNDTFHGLGGNDLLVGNEGDDVLYGGGGADVLAGWAGTDEMYGDDGDDTFLPGSGNDTGYGGAGQDYFTCNFVPEPSSFYWDGGDDDDLFALNEMTDGTIIGGNGAGDVLQVYWFGTTVLTPVIFTPDAASFLDLSLTISGIEIFRITTGSGHDSVTTGDGADVISLEWGANVARAMGGDDVVSYSVGLANDLDGGDGNDTLILMQVPWGSAMRFDASGSEVLDGFGSRLVGFETYQVSGLGSDDAVVLGGGADSFAGRRGNDSAWGGNGTDVLRGGHGDDSLYGEAGNDRLHGGDSNDALFGGAGGDRIYLGAGADAVEGGADADRFVFAAMDGLIDTVTDFETGMDRLIFSSTLLGTTLSPGRLPTAALSFGTAQGDQAQFVFRVIEGDGQLLWDINGSAEGGETALVSLLGVTAITHWSIYLSV